MRITRFKFLAFAALIGNCLNSVFAQTNLAPFARLIRLETHPANPDYLLLKQVEVWGKGQKGNLAGQSSCQF